jgi:hypothetical protein
MSEDSPDPGAKKSSTQILAALVAQRKAAGGRPARAGGARESERDAAARSAAKSKPALRK